MLSHVYLLEEDRAILNTKRGENSVQTEQNEIWNAGFEDKTKVAANQKIL